MKLILFNQEYEYENTTNSVEMMIKDIEEKVYQSNHVLSHLIIDGIEVYEQHEIYLTNHVSKMEKIEVVAKTIKEMVHNILYTTEDYLNRALPELKGLIKEFYQGPTSESWENFNQLLSGLQWFDQMIQTIDKGAYKPSNWNNYIVTFVSVQEEMRNLEEAVAMNDTIVLADILQYEVLNGLKTLKDEIGISIDQEGTRYNVN